MHSYFIISIIIIVIVVQQQTFRRFLPAQSVIEPNITLSVSTTGNEVSLSCWLNGFHPKTITVEWFKGTESLKDLNTYGAPKIYDQKTSFDALSQISIKAEDWNRGTEFTCQAKHNSKTFKQTLSQCHGDKNSKPPIHLEKPRLMSVLNGSQVSASCVVETAFNVKVSWLLNGKEQTGRSTENRLGVRTVSNLTITTDEWGKSQTVTCKATHQCFGEEQKTINITEPVQKTPTVVIRRLLTDVLRGESAVLECAGRDLPSGELSVTVKVNDVTLSEVQYADLPKGQDSLTARFTVPKTHRKKGRRFTCQIQQSRSIQWRSKSLSLFDDPSVELSAVSGSDKSTSTAQKLICFGTGFNPQITWLPKSVAKNAQSKATMQEDGRVKVTSEISVPQEDWESGVEITCHVSDEDNHTPVKKSTSVCAAHSNSKPPIHLEKPRLMSVLNGSQVSASCVVETAFKAKVSWLLNGKEQTGRSTENRLGVRTVSNLMIPTDEWGKSQTITCKATHRCFGEEQKTINITEPGQKTPTVVIRRLLTDVLRGESAVLECAGRDLPSDELSVTVKVNDVTLPEVQYVDLPKGQDSLIARFTVPKRHRKKGRRFICQIQQSRSIQWQSNSTGNLFDDPSVELSAVSGSDKSTSTAQKLICFGTGFNPQITWLPTSVAKNAQRKVTMQEDGRVKVTSEISVPQEDWESGVEITCQVSDEDNHTPVKKSTSVCAVTPDLDQKAQVYLLGPSIRDTRTKEKVNVTCLLLGHKLQLFSITWKVGDDISPKVATKDAQAFKVHSNGTQSVQIVHQVLAANWNAHTAVSCEVTHLCSRDTQQHNISKTRDVRLPTVRILSPSDSDLSGFRNTTLLCLIEGFDPADISVHWELNGNRLDESRFTNSPVGVRPAWGDYSMHSALTLLPSKPEDGTYSCVVSHESSEKPISSEIDGVYASVSENPPSMELLQAQDKLVCLVHNYSPSAINITWLLNNATVLHGDSISNPAKGSDGKFSIKSQLNIQASEMAPGATYTCHVKHRTGIFTRTISKSEFIEETIYFDENMSETSTLDQAEETWNMACAFIVLFVISLLYGCSVTLVKVKTA